ncbi:unnamed protein product [Linum tenue]|uniref:Uncharacterized protein n=1 Tax=Linum tenue TaxID=586396 RepID=A0AAV0H5G3_9ROSI|nr:unnamed protein product [Linum tenue]
MFTSHHHGDGTCDEAFLGNLMRGIQLPDLMMMGRFLIFSSIMEMPMSL